MISISFLVFYIFTSSIRSCGAVNSFSTQLIMGNSVTGMAEVYTVQFTCGSTCTANPVSKSDWQTPQIPGVSEIKRVTYQGKDAILATTMNGAIIYAYPSKQVLFQREIVGYGTNVHSAEVLPDGSVVLADSNGYLCILTPSTTVNQDSAATAYYPLFSAHGVVWDKTKQRLWALGYLEVQEYTYNQQIRTLTLVKKYSFDKFYDEPNHNEPLAYADGGHDFYPVNGKNGQLFISTGEHVIIFDTTTGSFQKDDNLWTIPSIKGSLRGLAVPNKGGIKSISNDGNSGAIFVRPSPWFKEINDGKLVGVSNYGDKGNVLLWTMPDQKICLKPDLDIDKTNKCRVPFTNNVLFYKVRTFIKSSFSY